MTTAVPNDAVMAIEKLEQSLPAMVNVLKALLAEKDSSMDSKKAAQSLCELISKIVKSSEQNKANGLPVWTLDHILDLQESVDGLLAKMSELEDCDVVHSTDVRNEPGAA